MQLDDHYFMRKAFEEAEFAFAADEVPVGAVIVIDQRIFELNLTERLTDVTAHAEMGHYFGGKFLGVNI